LDFTNEDVFAYHGKGWTPEVRLVHDYYNYKHFKNETYENFRDREIKLRGIEI
jgi:hypothetical protein